MVFRYFWQDVDTQVSRLSSSIKRLQFRPDMVVGIARGGLVPATILSYCLDVPVCSLQWQHRDLEQKKDTNQLEEIMIASKTGIVIVDDILDSGKTLKGIHETVATLLNEYPTVSIPIVYAVCVKRSEQASPVPNLIFGTELENFDWVYFPWAP